MLKPVISALGSAIQFSLTARRVLSHAFRVLPDTSFPGAGVFAPV